MLKSKIWYPIGLDSLVCQTIISCHCYEPVDLHTFSLSRWVSPERSHLRIHCTPVALPSPHLNYPISVGDAPLLLLGEIQSRDSHLRILCTPRFRLLVALVSACPCVWPAAVSSTPFALSWRVSTGVQSLRIHCTPPVSATQPTPRGGSVGIPWAYESSQVDGELTAERLLPETSESWDTRLGSVCIF